MNTRKLVASAAAVLTLSGGGLAVAAMNPFSTAGAATPTTAPVTTAAGTSAAPAAGRAHVLKDALAGLVKDGTLTQAQSDAVIGAVKQAGGKHGVLKRLGQDRKAIVATAADAIGIPAADLVTALKGGQSIAEVATAHGVEAKVVSDALVAKASSAVDQAVTDGKLTAEQATKVKARLPKVAERIVAAHRAR